MCKPHVAAVFIIAMVAACTSIAIKEKALNRQKRVIGGEPYTKGEYPFHVSLWFSGEKESNSKLLHYCGGILVDKQWVLSSAKCFDDDHPNGNSSLTLWEAKLGMHAQTKAYKEAQSCSILYKINAPEYNYTQVYADVVLLRLGCEAQLSDRVATIDVNDDPSCPQVGSVYTVIGWGYGKNGSDPVSYGEGTNLPRKATVEVTSNGFCKDRYQKKDISWWIPNLRIAEATLCAGTAEGGEGPCFSDDGSPLLAKCNGPNSPTVAVGLGSIGYGCALPFIPTIYSRLSHFSPWIKEIIGSK